MSDAFAKLIESFRRFPGIGPRQAKRFVYHLLVAGNAEIDQLAKNLNELKGKVARCGACQRFFPPALEGARANLCRLCADPGREDSSLMIVEKDVDLENLERAGDYAGRYFILGGLIPILEKNPLARIHWRELLGLIEKRGAVLKEIILALSASPQGDHTAEYLGRELATLTRERGIKLMVLGRGLSTGTELEYSDAETLKSALGNRRILND